MGDTPNIAARLQGLAAPNTVVISAATQQLIPGSFTCHALGVQTLKGVATPLQVYRVVRATEVQQRFNIAAARGLTPLVGREYEVEVLRDRWAQVQAGRGHIVVLSGEAGIGKSRLVQVCQEDLAGEAYTRLEGRCSPYTQQSALYPVVEQVQRWLQWREDDTSQVKLRKLEEALAASGFALEEVVPLFAALCAVPLPERYPPLTLTPQRHKQQTLAAVLAWWLTEAERQPVCLVLEDLHWSDPSTLELLDLLNDQVPLARLLVILTGRPEFRPPRAVRSHVTHLALGRLAPLQTAQMIQRITGGKALPAEVQEQLLEKTNGVPLFVEELTKMVVESGLVQEKRSSMRWQDHCRPWRFPRPCRTRSWPGWIGREWANQSPK